MNAFCEFLNHFSVEGWDVIWITAGDKPIIHNHFLIHLIGSSVDQIHFQ